MFLAISCGVPRRFGDVHSDKGREARRTSDEAARRTLFGCFSVRHFPMNLAKIWQLFRSSQQRSSRGGHDRRDRPQLAVESLEGRAMPSTLLPATALPTGLIDPVSSETVGRNFFGPNVNTFSIIIEIPSSRVAGEVSPTKLSSAGETGTRGSVSDDVGVDGRSITAQNPAMALSQNGRL